MIIVLVMIICMYSTFHLSTCTLILLLRLPPPSLSPLLTIIEAGLKVWTRSILHQHALSFVSVECDLWSLGSNECHKLTGILILLPVAVWQVMVRIAAVQIESFMLC